MASWLKAAEDLLEVVDRKAKLVVSEHSASQPSASNGEEVQARRTKSKGKGRSRVSRSGAAQSIKPEQEEKIIPLSVPHAKTENAEDPLYENSNTFAANQIAEVSTQSPSHTNKDIDISDKASSGVSQIEDGNDTNNSSEVPVTENDIDTPITPNIDVTTSSENGIERSSSSIVVGEGTEIISSDYLADAKPEVDPVAENASLIVDQARLESETVERHTVGNALENEKDFLPESPSKIQKQQEPKIDTPNTKVQDQLDEAQGLLKSTVTTGQSKEARLAKVCAGLSSRLQEYKSENAQLEELLVAERELSSSSEARIKQLQQNLSASRAEVARVESNLAEALAAKDSEIEALVNTVDAVKKQAASSEEKLVSLQANMDTIMRSRELSETRMMQALREELASTERRAEEERAAHNATKMTSVEREVELERRAVEASNALSRLQRTADESTSRASELEHKVALLEVECATLTQELQDMDARNRRGQKKSSEEANQILQMQAWQEEVERARQGQRDAEHKISSLEAELQKTRVEVAGMKRDAEHYSRQEHVELEKRYRELTDLLYHKQTQLEAVSSEKAAVEFQLEKERKRFQEAQVEAERNRAFRKPSTVWEEDTDIKALETLPLHHRHMAGASIQLQRAAKILDTGAVRATRFLWQYPVARVLLLIYLVFVHLFLMYLLHRLQEQADDFASREVAVSMGLGNSSLP